MAKLLDNDVYDAALNEIATCVMLRVCSGEPTTRAEAVTNTLANVVIDGSDFTNADGVTSGRRVTVGAQSSFSVGTTGVAAVITLDDGTTMLLKTNETTGQTLTSGNTVSTPAFDCEFLDPT